jgi:hypothetical protein
MQITGGGTLATPQTSAWRAQLERNAFKGLDADSNGAIGLDEFKAGLQNLPAGRSAPAGTAGGGGVEAAFKALDTDGDGQLSEAELKSAMQARGHHRHHRQAAESTTGQAASALGGVGNFLLAQFFGQAQPPTTAGGSGTNAGSGGQGNATDLAEQARRQLMRYAATQAAAGTGGGLASA